MTTPTGSPDWLKPIPGGSHKLVDAVVAAGPNSYLSGILDVTKYNGLYVEIRGTGPAATFVIVDIHYYDDPAGTVSTTTWQGIMRANQTAVLNVPALGPYAQVDLTAVGGAPFTASRVIMVGHNGGPSSGVRNFAGVLAELVNQTIPANSSIQVDATIMAEGPGSFLALAPPTQSANINVWAFDASGGRHLIGRRGALAAGNAETIPIWIPPQPVEIEVANPGAAAANYYGTLTLGHN